MTDSVSIHGWNKKTRHSLTKGFLSGGKGMWQLPKGQWRLPESQVISALNQGRKSQSALLTLPREEIVKIGGRSKKTQKTPKKQKENTNGKLFYKE